MKIKFGTIASGIEAASVAWNPLGWKCQFVSEIAKFPNAVLAKKYPEVANLGDFKKYAKWKRTKVDVLCAGTPCLRFAGLVKESNWLKN